MAGMQREEGGGGNEEVSHDREQLADEISSPLLLPSFLPELPNEALNERRPLSLSLCESIFANLSLISACESISCFLSLSWASAASASG